MSAIGVMSYNMSFASDQGKAIGSEKHFIKQGGNWDNALGLIGGFFDNADLAPAVVGLQEINDAEFLKATGVPAFIGGTTKLANFVGASIQTAPLAAGEGVEPATKATVVGDEFQYAGYAQGAKYALAFWGPAHAVPFPPKALRPVLAMIWNTSVLGEKVSDYGADLGTDKIFVAAGKKQQGRPIYIVKTSKGYLLVNLHGPNYADESLKGMPVLRESLEFHLLTAAAALGADMNKVLIMGDFNDPHFGINDSNPLMNFKNGRNAEEKSQVLSCCYNFNSSCPIGIYNSSGNTIGPVLVSELPEDIKAAVSAIYPEVSLVKALPYECFISVSPKVDGKFPEDNEEVPNPFAREMTPSGRGNLENYKFTGDYVMSNLEVVTPLTLLRTLPTGNSSKESDHEPIYAIFRTPLAGGKRRKSTRRHHGGKKRLSRKQQKSRRR